MGGTTAWRHGAEANAAAGFCTPCTVSPTAVRAHCILQPYQGLQPTGPTLVLGCRAWSPPALGAQRDLRLRGDTLEQQQNGVRAHRRAASPHAEGDPAATEGAGKEKKSNLHPLLSCELLLDYPRCPLSQQNHNRPPSEEGVCRFSSLAACPPPSPWAASAPTPAERSRGRAGCFPTCC